MTTTNSINMPTEAGFSGERDFSDENGDDFEALSRDVIPVRSMIADDINHLISIDRRITGMTRKAFYQRKVTEALEESGIRISLIAEIDGLPVGFIMARVDFGEFGRTESEAVIDTLGVNPGISHQHVGLAMMSQLLANLSVLKVERVRTEVNWDQFDLLGFLKACGFEPAQRLSFRRAT
ncbi:MAG: GNAT family N-acetyltransferase [Fimbriimonadaceae bacterium]|nr:GNAT family N-acetyltransferase [Alphaproteobacteria bacterium]